DCEGRRVSCWCLVRWNTPSRIRCRRDQGRFFLGGALAPSSGGPQTFFCVHLRQLHTLGRGRPLRDREARAPFVRWPDRPRRETAAAVRADVVQLVLNAVGAKRAFEGALSRRTISVVSRMSASLSSSPIVEAITRNRAFNSRKRAS